MVQEYDHEGLGYRRDLEDMDELLAGAQAADTFLVGDIDPKALGVPMGMIDVIRLENQARINSCSGNSATSVLEACVYHQSQGQVSVQLSRMWAYVKGQAKNHIVGDRGATLGGVVAALREGCCVEELAPYTGAYYTQFPREAYDRAPDYKLATYSQITDVDQVYEGLANRIGGAYFGAAWCGEFRNPRPGGLVNRFHEDPGVGFHATCMLDWCEELDEKGYPRLRLFNSHGSGYGDRGTSLWSRDAVNDMIHAPNTTAFFLSDMNFIKPRFNFKKAHWLDVD